MSSINVIFRFTPVALILSLASCDTPQGQETFGNILQAGGNMLSSFGNNQTVRNFGGITAVVGTVIVIRAREAQASQLAEARRRANSYSGHSRYIAQRVTKDKKATGAATVVLYDTKTQKVVGDSVYDLKSVPGKGKPLAIGGKTAAFSP